ncbi:hypothetical protein [Methanococcoides sp. AM1]|uniref:hypothetical protein n=1 Tax=Methanococcoides sp. AM1 TaxID=1201011 RepID=UPI0010823DB6|nr:hypothetical protein [Methanococcoides sp. AM1]
MQSKTIWLITILLVIATLFSALAVADETLPPGNVTDLSGNPGEMWIDWSWTNPSDIDFDHVEIYLDGIPETTTSSASYFGVVKDHHIKARGRGVNFLDDIQVAESDVSEIASDSTNAQERSGQPADTMPPVQVNEVRQVDIKQKIKALEDFGIISDVVHKNKK